MAICEGAGELGVYKGRTRHLHPTPSRLRVTAANSAVTGEIVPVANKSEVAV